MLKKRQASPAASAKPDRAQLEAQFTKGERRPGRGEGEDEGARRAAGNAMQIASDIAWLGLRRWQI